MTQPSSEQLGILMSIVEDLSQVVLVLGSGISRADPTNWPSWHELVDSAVQKALARGLDERTKPMLDLHLERKDYYAAMELLKKELPPATYEELLRQCLPRADQRPNYLHRLVASVKCSGIVTTNFDHCLEVACVKERDEKPRIATYYATAELAEVTANLDEPFIVKLHGDLDALRRIVLTAEQCEEVSSCEQVKNLFAALIAGKQLVMLGYSCSDPDFWAIWSDLQRSRVLRRVAVVCLPYGELTADQEEKLRVSNLQLVKFPNQDGSYAYAQQVLEALAGRATVPRRQQPPPVGIASHIEDYVLLYQEFQPEAGDRFLGFVAALCLSELCPIREGANGLARTDVARKTADILGLVRSGLEPQVDDALRQLQEDGLVEVTGDVVSPTAKGRELERIRRTYAERDLEMLTSLLPGQRGGSISVKDLAGVAEVVDEVFLWTGRQMAEQVLFGKLPAESDVASWSSIVESECKERGLPAETLLPAIRRLLIEPTDEESDWLFRKLQAHFLTTAFVLHPDSERVVRGYASRHLLYLDSSIALPLLAEAHPLHEAYVELINQSRSLGVSLRISTPMLKEISAHLGIAIQQFETLQGPAMKEALELYAQCTGEGHGNVFLEGFLGNLRQGIASGWASYIGPLVERRSQRLQPAPPKIQAHLRQAYGVESPPWEPGGEDGAEIERLTDCIMHLRRKRATEHYGRKLSEHEATQFLMIQRLRASTPELQQLVWFLTTDTTLYQLQVSERRRYPLPSIYSPVRWCQYMNLLDYRARSRKHFSKLMRKAEYGVLSGKAAAGVIRSCLARIAEAKLSGDSARILLETVRRFHAKQTRSQPEVLDEEKTCEVLEEVVDGLVIQTREDVDKLNAQLATEKTKSAESELKRRKDEDRYTKQIRRLEHRISVLKQRKPGKK